MFKLIIYTKWVTLNVNVLDNGYDHNNTEPSSNESSDDDVDTIV